MCIRDRSAAVLGDIFGVSDRRIRQMAEEGIIVRVAKGRYNFQESVKNYILSLKLAVDTANQDNPDGELNIEEEKALHERVKPVSYTHLDPCADEYNHKCNLYFDKNTNGLLQSWGEA